MKSTRFFFNFTLTIALLAGAAGLMFSQSGQPASDTKDKQPQKGPGRPKAPERPGSIEKIKVHGKALEGNLEGDSPDRDVFVYLPASYTSSPNRRYPVVYFLHGYAAHAETYWNSLSVAAAADAAHAEMILVLPDAFTVYDGSMFSNSPTTGDWETFVASDLVNHIDGHYRTI